MTNFGPTTDEIFVAIDLAEILAAGLTRSHADAFRRLFSEGAVGAAIRADGLGIRPRALTFLAEIVRRGGIGYAATLAEPMPTSAQSAMVADWLVTASVSENDDIFARWLDAVAEILEVRQATRTT